MVSAQIITITGPTGVGKTDASLRLAEILDAEIVSIDSRQIYKELDIGTAKPAAEELARIPHHFVSERSVRHPLSSGAFARLAEERIASILARGKQPIVVGGSTLYLYALQHGLADIPEVAPATRAMLASRLAKEGAQALFSELTEVDPTAALTMDATKSQRVLRALEVYHGTGRPLSDYHASATPPAFSYRTFVFERERDILYKRINTRVDMMLEAGLLEEVASLKASGFDMNLPVFKTIGYQEPLQYLRGDIDETEMVRLLKRNSRRYAKRQLTWFRRFETYTWVEADQAYEKILAEIH